MPDWMSHLLLGLIAAELFSVRKKSLVVLGALMPDLISKFLLLFFYLGFWNNLGLDSFHTPLVSFLLAVLIAPLFRYDRVKTILLIILGLVTHFLSDFMIRHYTSGMRLMFPISMSIYRFDLIWPEQSIYFLMVSFVVYVLIRIVKKIEFEKAGV